MVVLGADEGGNRDKAVAAWPVFDHNRMTPAGAELLRDQPCSNVSARAGAERQYDFDRPLRPRWRHGCTSPCQARKAESREDQMLDQAHGILRLNLPAIALPA